MERPYLHKRENTMNSKTRDLLIVTVIYLISFAGGYASCFFIENTMLKFFIFDITATVICFIFSLAFHNSSVYDPYWSLTPMIMSLWLFIEKGAFGIWQILFLIVFNIWSARLTLNWAGVFTDFTYEDWRYRMFRDNNGPFMWFFLNFTGIHMVPTLVVFAGMLPLFVICEDPLGFLSIFGVLIMLFGISMEIFADRQMHAFWEKKEKTTCREGLWKYSRHPNYLGEISVWVGVFVAMLPYAPDKWYFGVGALCMILLFNVVSIPMMEKRQMTRRPDYVEYRKTTSRLVLWMPKKG